MVPQSDHIHQRITLASRLECNRASSIPCLYCVPPFDFTCSTAWIGMVETLKIAFVSTVFGMIISLPISLLAEEISILHRLASQQDWSFPFAEAS